MQLAKVIGSVVSVRKVGNLKGLKLLVVEFLDEGLTSLKKTAVCADTVQAGPGDLVLTCSSSSARMTKDTKNVCIDNTIVGIIDSVNSENKWIYRKGDK